MKDYSDPIRAVYAACVDECMAALCRHFNTKSTGYDGTFAYQTVMLAQLGAARREVADIIARHTAGMEGMVSEAVRTAMLKAVKEVEPSLMAAVKAGVVDGTEVPVSESIQTALSSYSRQAVDQLNLVNTVMLESCLNNYRALVSNTAAYEAQLDKAQQILNAQTGKVLTGVNSHQQAVRQAVQRFARTSLTVFTDKAGHRWSPEAYAAMDIRTTVNNAARQAVLDRNEEYGNDLVSVPINATARPKCFPWQGKVISTANEARTVTDLHDKPIRVYAISETTYGEPDGLWGINCHHQPTPFFAGLSVLRGEVPDKADNDALYALTQQQRRLERDVRNLKREAVMLDAAGDAEGFAIAARKVKAAQSRLREHCEQNSLPMRSDRTQVLGFDQRLSRKATKAAQQQMGPVKPSRQTTPQTAPKVPKRGKAAFANAGGKTTKARFSEGDYSYRSTLEARFQQGSKTVQQIYDKYIPAGGVVEDGNWRGKPSAYYSPSSRKIRMNFADDAANPRGVGSTWLHEHGHSVDHAAGYLSRSSDFRSALQQDFDTYISNYMSSKGIATKTEAYAYISLDLEKSDQLHSVSDLFGGLSRNRCVGSWQHSTGYWRDPNALTDEAFAHMFEASFSQEKVVLFNTYFPTAFAVFNQLIGGNTP